MRAFANTRLATPASDSDDAERLTLRILNTFEIVPGVIREPNPAGGEWQEITDWVTVANLTGSRYSYRNHTDPSPYVVDFASVDLSKERIVPLAAPRAFQAAAI